MTRADVLKEFSRPYQSYEDVGGPDNEAMADEIVRLREELTNRLTVVETDAKRYVYLRSLLRHYKWRDVDPIHELAPEFEKYITDDDLDVALDEQIKYEEREVNNDAG